MQKIQKLCGKFVISWAAGVRCAECGTQHMSKFNRRCTPPKYSVWGKKGGGGKGWQRTFAKSGTRATNAQQILLVFVLYSRKAQELFGYLYA